MGRKKYLKNLREFAERSGFQLQYELVSEEPRRAIMKAVVNGEIFHGVGENKRKAKQNAAKSALRCLDDKENPRARTGAVAKTSAAQKSKNLTERVENIQAKMVANIHGACGKDPVVSSCSAVCDDPSSELYPLLTSLDLGDAKSKSVTSASVSSNHPEDQNKMCPEKESPGPSDRTSAPSKICRCKTEFEFIELIGKGGFGQVFKVKDKLVGTFYALKVARCKEMSKALREVKALSDLDHRHIVRFHSCWVEDSGELWDSTDSCSTSQSSSDSPVMSLFILMELCDTKTLREWIAEQNDQDVTKSQRSRRRKQSLSISVQIAGGVAYIHSKLFIHRDLKPANILFGLNGSMKIGDFGLVSAESNHGDGILMERTAYKGTPSYMAPEQKSEKTYNRKVDVFSLGLIFFELLWKISSFHEKDQIWKDLRRQKFPREFEDRYLQEYIVIKSMLSKKPKNRPEASRAKSDLEECLCKLSAGRASRSV